MADNVPITSGAGLTIASDEDGSSLQHQWVKIKFGGDGSFSAVTTAAGFPVQILSLPDLGLNSVVKITSLPDLGLNSVVKITSLPDLGLNSVVKITSLPPFPAVTATVTNAGTFAVQTTGIVSISSNTNILTVSGTTIAITSLPDLGLNSSVKVSSLPPFPVVLATVTNAGTFVVQATGIVSISSNTSLLTVSGTTIAITSLPALGFGGLVSISNLSITVSNLSTVPLTVSGTTIAITSLPAIGFGGSTTITSLPDLGLNSSVKITSLPALTSASVSVSNLATTILSINNLTVNTSINSTIGNFPVQIIPARSSWRFTATQTAAGTIAIKAIVASATAIYVTNLVISNENTAGNASLIESSTAIAIRPIMERMYFAANGGMALAFNPAIACDTNTGLFLLTRTVTNHSIFISGFTAPISTSL